MPAIFTALIGGYEQLNEQPMAARSSIPFICFTDDPGLVSDSWKIEVVEPVFPRDPIRSARRLKILGHPLLEDLEMSLWIDNSVILERPPEELLDGWLQEAELALPAHSYRDVLLDEFDAIVNQGLDDPNRVYEQLQHYYEQIPDVLSRKPAWTAILARRHTPAVRSFCNTWFDHVLRYSRRDQLSVLAAVELTPELVFEAHEIDNHSSKFHRWPVTFGRDRAADGRDASSALKPLIARVHDLEQAVETLERLRCELREREADLEQATAIVADLEYRLALVYGSRSWRIGRALVRAAGPMLRPARRLLSR